jgi:hypothetical protein
LAALRQGWVAKTAATEDPATTDKTTNLPHLVEKTPDACVSAWKKGSDAILAQADKPIRVQSLEFVS